MAIKAVVSERLTSEEKDERGKIWASNDDGVTYWFDSLDDMLPWMEEHDPSAFEAIAWRMARKSTNG